MQSGWYRRFVAPQCSVGWHRAAFAAALAISAAGCAGMSQPTRLSDGGGATLAFESIDGLPADVARKFNHDLTEEAAARQMTVVAREANPNYRIRSYVSPRAEHGGISVAWAWDVYSSDQRHAVRLSGEEITNSASSKTWEDGNDPVLRRIARTGMTQLAQFLSNSPQATAEPSQPQNGSLASFDDFGPEAAGIFRIFRTDAMAADSTTPDTTTDTPQSVPLPRRRPAPAPRAALAYAPQQ